MADITGTISQIPLFGLPRENKPSATGLQNAHGYGNKFVKTKAKWLQELFPGAGAEDASWHWNFAQFGETKGTAAALGTSVHSGQQVAAFDAFFYNTVPGGQPQVLNDLENEFRDALPSGDRDTILDIKTKSYCSRILQPNTAIGSKPSAGRRANTGPGEICCEGNVVRHRGVALYLRDSYTSPKRNGARFGVRIREG